METEENVKLLTQLKVDVNLKDKLVVGLVTIDLIDANVQCTTRRGNTALHVSIMNKRKTIVKLLLEAGADISIPSPAGTCLELAKVP